MSSAPKDGGPAFPLPSYVLPNGQVSPEITGMSLRDWFAGQALAGSVGNVEVTRNCSEFAAKHGVQSADTRAAYCYQLADAMLREKKTESGS